MFQTLDASKTSVGMLSPVLHNVHEISIAHNEYEKVSPAAFLDILMPSYSPPERDCHYFMHANNIPQGGYVEGDRVNFMVHFRPPDQYYTESLPAPYDIMNSDESSQSASH